MKKMTLPVWKGFERSFTYCPLNRRPEAVRNLFEIRTMSTLLFKRTGVASTTYSDVYRAAGVSPTKVEARARQLMMERF